MGRRTLPLARRCSRSRRATTRARTTALDERPRVSGWVGTSPAFAGSRTWLTAAPPAQLPPRPRTVRSGIDYRLRAGRRRSNTCPSGTGYPVERPGAVWRRSREPPSASSRSATQPRAPRQGRARRPASGPAAPWPLARGDAARERPAGCRSPRHRGQLGAPLAQVSPHPSRRLLACGRIRPSRLGGLGHHLRP